MGKYINSPCFDERKKDCKAYSKSGYCKILTSTYPSDKLCPFFKPKSEVEYDKESED